MRHQKKVAALDLGADDDVVKPFDTEELLARIRAALSCPNSAGSVAKALVIGRVATDLGARRVTRDGEEVRLTRKKYAVLSELARHPNRVLTHAALLRAAWSDADIDDIESLRVTVRGIGVILEENPAASSILSNGPDVGYHLVV